MSKIICDATPFCYGPISKLVTISEYLKRGNDITFLATGTSLEMAKKAGYNTIECNTLDNNELSQHQDLIEESDLYINVMSRSSARFINNRIPVAFVDSLFYMWDYIPECLFDTEFYFIQNFNDISKQLERFGNKIKNKYLIGPIVDERFVDDSKPKKNQVLVDFGGMESKSTRIGVDSNYPFIMADIIIDSLSDKYEKILFAGSERPIRLMNERYQRDNIEFSSLSHENFLRELNQSKAILKSPGLTSTFEAFLYGIPAYFLPPQNYSQFLNLKRLRHEGVASKSIHWLDFYPEMDIEDNIEEKTGVVKTLDCLSRFENDKAAQEKTRYKIEKMFIIDDYELSEKQRLFVEKSGGNGAKEIVNTITKFLGGNNE